MPYDHIRPSKLPNRPEPKIFLLQMSQPLTQPFNLCPDYHESEKTKATIPQSHKKRKAGESSTSAASVQHLRPGMVLLKGFVKPEDQIQIVRTKLQEWCQNELMDDVSWKELGSNYTLIWTNPSNRWSTSPRNTEAFKMIAQTANSTASGFPQINRTYASSTTTPTPGSSDFTKTRTRDTAEFMFGDTRDKDQATKINLESGDVLILGGESRLK
ncbi:hypothetical protein U9M48_028049 [Paspalum notatum var. saurae]|uniref:Uncharacterized protein n=1 Tax=Paspalum notatum var. saurae TaxID=547442 RepID=A0AAQ3TYD5_PASNO